jgi:hypothetical protein
MSELSPRETAQCIVALSRHPRWFARIPKPQAPL